jgi:hypothetical protein
VNLSAADLEDLSHAIQLLAALKVPMMAMARSSAGDPIATGQRTDAALCVVWAPFS